MIGCNVRNKNKVLLLIDKGANIEAKNNDGKTPLMISCEKRDKDIISLLINKGANIEAKDNDGKTVLITACEKRNKEIVALLLDRGANIEAEINKRLARCESTPLLVAVQQEDKEIVALLLDREANPDKKIVELLMDSKTVIEHSLRLRNNEIYNLIKNHNINSYNSQKLVETLTKFTTAKSNLKHTTHHWDMGQREGKWKDINSFLEDIKEDWKGIDDDLKNISPNLHSTIEAFLFNNKLGEKNPKSNQSCVYSWGEYHLKIGWSSPELIKWCNENPKESPFNYMLDNSKREVIEGVAIDRFSDVINIFKNEIEIRSDKNQLKKIFRNLKKTLKSDFILSIDVSLEGVEFYTDVESFKESLVLIFKMMQERESSPQIKVWAEKFIDKGYIELYITQIASCTRKEPQEIINKIQKDDGGDMGKILSKLSSLCDWSIAYPFDEKKSYTIDLLDSETNQITFEEANNIEGFTHILRFYK